MTGKIQQEYSFLYLHVEKGVRREEFLNGRMNQYIWLEETESDFMVLPVLNLGPEGQTGCCWVHTRCAKWTAGAKANCGKVSEQIQQTLDSVWCVWVKANQRPLCGESWRPRAGLWLIRWAVETTGRWWRGKRRDGAAVWQCQYYGIH